MGVSTTIVTIGMAHGPDDSIFYICIQFCCYTSFLCSCNSYCTFLHTSVGTDICGYGNSYADFIAQWELPDHHQHNASCIVDFKRRYCIFPSITSHLQILKLITSRFQHLANFSHTSITLLL